MDPEKLQQAWQAQSDGKLGTNPEWLFRMVRFERLVYLLCDIFGVAAAIGLGALFLVDALRDIQQRWPWLIFVVGEVWVLFGIAFNRWRQRRHAPHQDDSLLTHIDWSIKDIEQRIAWDRQTFWWYWFPSALGLLVPPLFFFSDNTQRPLFDRLMPWLGTEVIFASIFVAAYLVTKYLVPKGVEMQRRELADLRALRESLLKNENVSAD